MFDDPFRFDVGRTPNPQVSFGGGGAHFCLGAALARREISVLFDELLNLVGEPEYSVTGIDVSTSFGLKHLPVRLTPR